MKRKTGVAKKWYVVGMALQCVEKMIGSGQKMTSYLMRGNIQLSSRNPSNLNFLAFMSATTACFACHL